MGSEILFGFSSQSGSLGSVGGLVGTVFKVLKVLQVLKILEVLRIHDVVLSIQASFHDLDDLERWGYSRCTGGEPGEIDVYVDRNRSTPDEEDHSPSLCPTIFQLVFFAFPTNFLSAHMNIVRPARRSGSAVRVTL